MPEHVLTLAVKGQAAVLTKICRSGDVRMTGEAVFENTFPQALASVA